jgi:hypothetical protein
MLAMTRSASGLPRLPVSGGVAGVGQDSTDDGLSKHGNTAGNFETRRRPAGNS